MITPSFSPTATERVLPKLALDFTTASLDSRITFTRTTDATHPATYVSSSGYVTSATNNAPRFDYDAVTLTCQGLLIEESRTNIVTYSEDLRTAAEGGSGSWVGSGAGQTIAFNQTSPANVSNAGMTLTWIGTTGRRYFQITPLTGTTYTNTCFVKKGNTQYASLQSLFSGGTSKDVYCVLNFNNGTVAVQGADTANASVTVKAFQNDWYRISVTHTDTGANTVHRLSVAPTASDGTTIVAGNTIVVWGAQMETGAFATSYIPTTSAALTRNADVATMTGTNFSDWFNASEGAVETAVIPSTVSGTRPLVQFDDNTATNQICLRGNAANPELYIKATTDQAQIDAGTITANTSYKLTGAWNTNDCAAAQNGASPVTDNTATIPTVSQARIGSDGTNYANAWLQKINYWPQRITNAEVQAFSK